MISNLLESLSLLFTRLGMTLPPIYWFSSITLGQSNFTSLAHCFTLNLAIFEAIFWFTLAFPHRDQEGQRNEAD